MPISPEDIATKRARRDELAAKIEETRNRINQPAISADIRVAEKNAGAVPQKLHTDLAACKDELRDVQKWLERNAGVSE